MVIQEANRYADSEFRYSDRADDAAVARLIRDARVRDRAVKEMEELKLSASLSGSCSNRPPHNLSIIYLPYPASGLSLSRADRTG